MLLNSINQGFPKNIKQHIRMISEVPCDTEDWSNGWWKFSVAITWINYILKYIPIKKQLI